MAANDGDHPVGDLFGVTLPASTGAGGSPGATLADARPDDAYHVPVNGPYASAQAPLVMAGVGTDDINLPQQTSTYNGGDPLTGIAFGDTGAGSGSVSGPPHPNAAAASFAAQVQAARSPR